MKNVEMVAFSKSVRFFFNHPIYIYILAQYLSNTEMQYPKIMTKPITEISKYCKKIANIAIFLEWNI